MTFSWKWASIKWVTKWLRERSTYKTKIYRGTNSQSESAEFIQNKLLTYSCYKHCLNKMIFSKRVQTWQLSLLQPVFWEQVLKASKVNGVSSYLVPKKSKTWKKKTYEAATSKAYILKRKYQMHKLCYTVYTLWTWNAKHNSTEKNIQIWT